MTKSCCYFHGVTDSKSNSDIASALTLKHLEDGGASSFPAGYDNQMRLSSMVKLWYQNLKDVANDFGNQQNHTVTGPNASSANHDIPMEDDDNNSPELWIYRKFISNRQAYEWLVGSIRRELNLNPANQNSQDAIRNRILESLPSPRTSSPYDKPRIYQTTFAINWDPVAFVREQGYDQNKGGFLGKIITITGSSIDAQAMTSLQYLHQTWHSYGANLLQIIEATLLSEPGSESRCD